MFVSAKSAGTSTSERGARSNMEIKEIPVQKLKVDEFNVRGDEWKENPDIELTGSIKREGIIEPLVVRKIDDKVNPYGIVCGNRRWHAAIDAGLKNVPCVVRELDDKQSIGISLQENLARRNLDPIKTSEAIIRLWDMTNGGRTYEEKIESIQKVTGGMGETTIRKYRNIGRVADSVKERLLPSSGDAKLDMDSVSSIATGVAGSSDPIWNESEQEEAAEIVSRFESKDERREIILKLKDYPDLSPKEAYDKVKGIKDDRSLPFMLPHSMVESFDNACSSANKSWKEIIIEALQEWLEKRGY